MRRFALAGHVRYRVIDGEAVVVVQDKGEVLGLNGTGSRAFDLAARGHGFVEIVDQLAAEHDVERGELEADLTAFFDELVAGGLLAEVP